MSPRLWEWLSSSPPLRAAPGSSRPAAVLLQTASSGCAAFPPGTGRRAYGSPADSPRSRYRAAEQGATGAHPAVGSLLARSGTVEASGIGPLLRRGGG